MGIDFLVLLIVTPKIMKYMARARVFSVTMIRERSYVLTLHVWRSRSGCWSFVLGMLVSQ